MNSARMVVTVPDGPHYRADAVADGAKAIGYSITRQIPDRWQANDVLVTWNLHRNQHEYAIACRAAGGAVLVMENGYLGSDADGRQLYSLARDAHNGAGQWPRQYLPEPDLLQRWIAQRNSTPPLMDYSRPGYTLVIGQRGIGAHPMRSPSNWHHHTGAPFAARTWPFSTVRIREHPGQNPAPVSLADDLAGAARLVIWSSACGVAALQAGIPVWYGAPYWVASKSASCLKSGKGWHIFRQDHLIGMSWVSSAQWSLAEIASGVAFSTLLSLP